MGLARDLARLRATGGGQLADAYLASLTASKLSGQVPDANAPSGSVIQVVQTYHTSVFTKSGASFTDFVGMAAALTPINSGSKIFIQVQVNGGISGQGCISRMRRTIGGAVSYVGQPNAVSGANQSIMATFYDDGDTNDSHSYAWFFLDSPGTTNSVNYQLEVNCIQGGTVIFGDLTSQARNQSYASVTPCSITLMEIAQ